MTPQDKAKAAVTKEKLQNISELLGWADDEPQYQDLCDLMAIGEKLAAGTHVLCKVPNSKDDYAKSHNTFMQILPEFFSSDQKPFHDFDEEEKLWFALSQCFITAQEQE